MNIKVKPLYHLTRFSRGITCNRKQEFVFLTDDIKVPIQQLGSNYSPEGWVVLQVDVEGLQVEPHRTTGLQVNQIIPNEFVINTPIHPERINHEEEVQT
ncbi:MAG: hypothetical protein EBT07_18055 [Actinobacteria bacterium]|nr:hypothetical protein [Actinomycetota bacterium]